MKTRQIELPLETAKRWYEQGGELKEMALGAFSEKELIGDGLSKTWDEYCAKHGDMGVIIKASLGTAYVALNKHVFSDYKQTQAYIAKMKLHLLRDEYRQGWKPDWSDSCNKYGIKWNMIAGKAKLDIAWCKYNPIFFSFPTDEIASEFLTNFRGIIEEAGDLI